MARDGTAVEAPAVERGKEIDYVAAAHVYRAEFAAGRERSELLDVAAIGVKGVLRKAFFDPQTVQKCANVRFHYSVPSEFSEYIG